MSTALPDKLTRANTVLERMGPRPHSDDATFWQVSVSGSPVGEISNRLLVPSAKRVGIDVEQWDSSVEQLANALRALADFLFDEEGVHKIDTGSPDTEPEVIRAKRMCGFVEEGRLRDVRIVDGQWRDRLAMGMLREDWSMGMNVADYETVIRPARPVDSESPPIPAFTSADRAVMQGQRVKLRRKCPEDKELFYGWLCRPEWWRYWMPESPGGFSPPTRERFQREWSDTPSPNEWIVETERGIPLGVCFVCAMDRTNRSAEAAILLYESEFWGKGYGTDAYGVLVRHMFRDLKLHRISSGTWSGNIGSLRMQLKNGFKVEKMGRENYLIDGEWYDGLATGLIEDEWRDRPWAPATASSRR